MTASTKDSATAEKQKTRGRGRRGKGCANNTENPTKRVRSVNLLQNLISWQLHSRLYHATAIYFIVTQGKLDTKYI